MKKAYKILIALGICLVVAVIVFLLSLDSIVKAGIEKVGSIALGTDTTVKSAHIGLTSGSAEITNLVIANPSGFPEGNLLELGRVKAGLRVGSLMGDTIEVNEITVEKPVLRLAQSGTKTNLKVVLDNASGGGEATPKESKGESSAGKKFAIKRISITGGELEYRVGNGPPVKVPLPDIVMEDVSNDDGTPLMLADVFAKVLGAMGKSAVTNVKDLPGDLAGALKGVGATAVTGVKETVGGVEDAVKGIGGLFKKPEETKTSQ